MPKFEIGDKGAWVSRAGVKTGECVGVIPEGADPSIVFSELIDAGFHCVARIDELKIRYHDTYVFAGPPGPRGGRRKLYWPRSYTIEKITDF